MRDMVFSNFTVAFDGAVTLDPVATGRLNIVLGLPNVATRHERATVNG